MDEPRTGEIHVFGPFRLDAAERTLTREGAPVPLRAKVFDTLVTLLERPGRLVTRQELIAAVWPDSIVEEGNLSHNMSALRKALGEGHGGKFVETVPKRGYRFVHPVELVSGSSLVSGGSPEAGGELARARRYFAEGAWRPAYDALARARERAPLSGADAMLFAEAARWTGRFDELVPLLEAAAEAYRSENEPIGAARAALELATVLLDRRRLALAASYFRQAERALPEDPGPGARERARLSQLAGRLRWAEGDWTGALEHSRAAAALARAIGDRDVEAMARMDGGHSLVALGRFDEAAAELDEAGGIVVSGEVGPYASGLTLCGLIYAWRACGRWDRAAEWVDASIRWADAAGVAYFPGLCRVHRGQLICLRGELARAEQDLALGAEELFRADSALAGPALRELGTVRLRRGNLPGAEEAFGRALELGTDPQPGLALLRAARGEPEAARRELERFLSEGGGASLNLLDREYRFEALGAHVTLCLATGEVDAAREAARELDAIVAATGSSYHRAAAEGAAGEIAAAEGRSEEAVALLRGSWRAWTRLPAPYEAACVRERLGSALLAAGDAGRARMELEGAATTYERLGAELDLRRLIALLGGGRDATAKGPRVVACGEIAGAAKLRSLLGDEAWDDLATWLERLLTRCWSEHGGRPLGAEPGRYAVAFDTLPTCLSCVAFVQRSLREHRALHGFAPELHLVVADTAALPGAGDTEALLRRLHEVARSGRAGRIDLVAEEATASSCAGLTRLREEGVDVRLLSPAELDAAGS